RRRHSARLRAAFGPEYEHTLRKTGDRRRAEAELEARRQRRETLDIRELEPSARDSYRQRWQKVQTQFVDAPSNAVREADRLVTEVMRERGYPVDDFERRTADISVDHPHLAKDYRAAHEISAANGENRASTEDLRRAMQHYRSLFDELLGRRNEQQR